MDGSGRFIGPLAATWSEKATPDLLARLLRTIPPGTALPVPPATDRRVWANDGEDQPHADPCTLQSLITAAEQERGAAWPQLTATSFARYFRDGDRDEYEAAVFARQERLTRAVVAAAVTLADDWIDEVADGITVLCEQSTWCWPAHDDTFSRRGSVVSTVSTPFLDLGAGEVVGQLAWADHLLGATLDARVPGIRARVRHEAHRRVFEPFVRRGDWHWLGRDGHVDNWNPWIHGNLLVSALQFVDDAAQQAALVAAIIEGIDRYIAMLPIDGAVDEGFGYWWNGACRALEALEVLAHATNGVLTAINVEQLRATVAFPHRMHLGGAWYLNVGDGTARAGKELPWHALHRAAIAFGDDDARRHAAAQRRQGEPVATEHGGLGRLLWALTDRAWIAAADSADAGPTLVREVWLPSTQILVARRDAGSVRGLTLAVKGGHNGENHNHNDVGEVVVACNGVPVVVDAGRPTYTASTFGPDRYRIWTMQSSWHCVPEIRGSEQATGREFAAADVEVQIDDLEARIALDIAGAYPRRDVRRWWRSARLDRRTGDIVIDDEWELDPACDPQRDVDTNQPPPTLVHYLLAGDVRPAASGSVVVHALDAAGAIVISWQPALQAKVTRCELDDPMLTRVWGDHLTRLSLETGTAAAGSLTVQLREA